MNTKGLLLICFGYFLAMAACPVFTLEAKAATDTEESFNLEDELRANAEADNPPSTGWINVVNEDYLVIDDSQYTITKETVYHVDKSQLIDGVFISFRRDYDNNLLELTIAEPTAEDLERKPDEPTGFVDVSGSEKELEKPKREDNLQYQDGKWVN
jgi:hypothetical protein